MGDRKREFSLCQSVFYAGGSEKASALITS